jgi:hypothetical protein
MAGFMKLYLFIVYFIVYSLYSHVHYLEMLLFLVARLTMAMTTSTPKSATMTHKAVLTWCHGI